MIVTALNKKGWTQTRLSMLTGINQQVLWNHLTGLKLGITARQIVRIALALNIDPHELAHAFIDHQIDHEVDKVLTAMNKLDETED